MNNTKIFKVAIYLRLSDEDKNKANKLDESESIKNQRNMLIEEINKHDNYVLFDEYCDEDLSGAGTFRPEFERLINDCKAKKIDIIMCKSQSRFSRDMEVIEKYLHNKFIEWNIRFIGLVDHTDTNITSNKKARQINGLVNEWYLEDVSNNIRSALKAKMKQGEFISPFAPYGYEINKCNNNKLIIDPIASETVKQIYILYLKGLGFTSISKYLNNNNIPSPSLYKYQKKIKLNITSNKPREEIKWSPNAIKTILTNEIYIGNLIQGKRTTVSYKNHKIKSLTKQEWIKKEHTHTPIISKEIYNKVQLLIQNRTKTIKSTGTVHNFSGKVFCKECNNYMRKKTSNKHSYLVCSNYENNICTNNNSIRYDKLEQIILEQINNLIKQYFDKTILTIKEENNKKKLFDNNIKLLNHQLYNVEKKITKNIQYLKSLYEDKVNNIITTKHFNILITEYNNNNILYNEQLKIIKNKIKQQQITNFTNINYDKYKQFNNLNKIIIDEFIDKIYIGKTNKDKTERTIYIKWNFN